MTRLGRPPVAPGLRFWHKVEQAGECWAWTATKNSGYGHFWHGTGRVYAHRWAYEEMVGPIPEGLTLDHICHDPDLCQGGPSCPHRSCVNPEHLNPVPSAVNTLRSNSITAVHARKTHCAHGHLLGPSRRCAVCRTANGRAFKARRRALRNAPLTSPAESTVTA